MKALIRIILQESFFKRNKSKNVQNFGVQVVVNWSFNVSFQCKLLLLIIYFENIYLYDFLKIF